MATERLLLGTPWPRRLGAGRVAVVLAWTVLAAALMLWPALWNGYPIVFADTGTYLSQAVHRYAGWDRPVFYSVFILPLHATVSLWPIVAVQALIALYVLRLVCRILAPRLPPVWQALGVLGLGALTWLPFLVSEVMPDLFSPLLVLLLIALAWAPDRIGRRKRWLLVPLAAFMTATQQSSVPVAVLLAGILAPLAVRIRRLRPSCVAPAVLVPVLAVAALCVLNLAAHHRFALSPFGNVFYLARLIDDGPAVAELRRACPESGWRLCPHLDRLPMESDAFLWSGDSPLHQAGGPKIISTEAGAIIAATLRHEPTGVIQAAAVNALRQLGRFDSGDGLEPWTAQVTPWLARDFPAGEVARYAQARQQAGRLTLPSWLVWTHRAVALAGVAGCLTLLPQAWPRRGPALGFLIAVLLVLPVAATVTGSLSGPHDRYQSRLMWLPPFIAALCAASARRQPA